MAKFDAHAVESEIRAAFEAYEAALAENDVDTLASAFWEDPNVVRLGPDGGLYGHDRITAFRKDRDTGDLTRELSEVRIMVFGPDWGVATCEYRRTGSGRTGAQSQVWMRRPEGWRIVSAHVSLGPAAPG